MGGRLVVARPEQPEEFATRLAEKGVKDVAWIGQFVQGPKGKFILENQK